MCFIFTPSILGHAEIPRRPSAPEYLDRARLSIGGGGAVFALIVAVEQGLRDFVGLCLERQGAIRHAGDCFQHDCVMRRIVRVDTPYERRMAVDQAGRHGQRIDGSIGLVEARHDGETRLMHVATLDGKVGERSGDRHRAVEVVGMRGAERGDGKAGLREAVANSEWV
jgi:hypothetical protein